MIEGGIMDIKLTEQEQRAGTRICIALDVPTVPDGLRLAEELSPFGFMYKVGKELHTAAGRERVDIIDAIYQRGGRVFLDLKLHDTPQTVYRAAKACCAPGVDIFNIHIAGGEKMCKEAVRGAYEIATSPEGVRMRIAPAVIGVTVLTSLNDQDLAEQRLGINYDDLVMRRTELARKWGLQGVVCPANKAGELERKLGGDGFKFVTPGIEWGGKAGEGQKQLYTPDRAVQDCKNSILVVGSAITTAGNEYKKDGDKKILVKQGTPEDRRTTAYQILQAMAPYV
jgi:orotidine-5'-phosphate decarboxylase